MEKKTKLSFYLTTEEVNMLNELLIKSIKDGNKKKLSSLVGSAIKHLYEKNITRE